MAQQSGTRTLSERGIYRLNLADRHHVYVVPSIADVAEDGVYAFLTTLADWGNGLGASYAVLTDGRVIEYPVVGAAPEPVATDGALFDTDRTADYADVQADVSDRVMARLGITSDMLNSMYVAGPLGGWLGTAVVDDIRRDWQFDPVLPFGVAAAECGVLTDEEAAWVDDDE